MKYHRVWLYNNTIMCAIWKFFLSLLINTLIKYYKPDIKLSELFLKPPVANTERKHLNLHLFSFLCLVVFLYNLCTADHICCQVWNPRPAENHVLFEPNLKESWTHFSKSILAPYSVWGLWQVLSLLGTFLTSRPILPLCCLIPGVLSSPQLSISPLGTITCWQIGLPLVQWLYLEPVWGPAIFTGMFLSSVANADPCRFCVHSSDQLARYQTIRLLCNS